MIRSIVSLSRPHTRRHRFTFALGVSSASSDRGTGEYLRAQGIDATLQQGILRALKSAYGRDPTISDLKSFGSNGLRDLALSVQRQSATKKHTRPSRSIHFEVPHHHTSFDLKWKLGESILDLAKSPRGELLGEYIEGTCCGQLSCCTCHVYLEQPAMPATEEAELDMLDLAYDPQPNSRLGCQIVLTEKLMEVPFVVTIPSGVNNVWK